MAVQFQMVMHQEVTYIHQVNVLIMYLIVLVEKSAQHGAMLVIGLAQLHQLAIQ